MKIISLILGNIGMAILYNRLGWKAIGIPLVIISFYLYVML